MSLKMYTGARGEVGIDEMADSHERERRYNCKGACKCGAKTSVKGSRVRVKALSLWSYAVKASGGRLFALYNGQAVVPCRGCSKPRYALEVLGTFDGSKFCDPRCMNATGHSCTCSCGGLNHGGGHDV